MTKVISNFNHKVNPEQLSKGLKMEQEHAGGVSKSTDISKGNKMVPAKIAVAHLKEDPKYYTHLQKMESKYDKK